VYTHRWLRRRVGSAFLKTALLVGNEPE